MRLLIVSQYFWPENFRVNELTAELARRGHQVTVLTGRPNYPEGRVFEAFRQDPGQFSDYAGARVLRVPLRPRGQGSVNLALNYLSFVFWASLLGPWLLRGQKVDAIFVFQTSPITAALPAILLGWLKRAPLLLWVLDLWPESLSAVGVVRSARLLRLVGALVAFIYRRCDRILVQSRAFYASVESWSGQTARIRYFPGWAEGIFTCKPDAAAIAPQVLPFADTFNVVFAGNIGDAQDFPAILQAAELLRGREELRWLILGEGRAANYVREEILRRKLQQRVILLGRHPLEDMPRFFRVAGALLVSLKAEPVFSRTIPGKVQSYMASGVPLLGMIDGEGARVIEESGAGLVCAAGDGQGLARRVEELMALSTESRAAMGLRGREYCLREFDFDRLITALEQWIREVLAPAGQGRD